MDMESETVSRDEDRSERGSSNLVVRISPLSRSSILALAVSPVKGNRKQSSTSDGGRNIIRHWCKKSGLVTWMGGIVVVSYDLIEAVS